MKRMLTLAAARVNAEMRQSDVAKELHVSTRTVVNWELGNTKISAVDLRRLSAMYNWPAEAISLPGEDQEGKE